MRAWEVETGGSGGSGVQMHPHLYSTFEVSLDYRTESPGQKHVLELTKELFSLTAVWRVKDKEKSLRSLLGDSAASGSGSQSCLSPSKAHTLRTQGF